VFQIHTALEERSVFGAEAVCHDNSAERTLPSYTTRSDHHVAWQRVYGRDLLGAEVGRDFPLHPMVSKIGRQIQIVASTLLRAVSPIQLCSDVYTSKPLMVRCTLRRDSPKGDWSRMRPTYR